jgi:hypothetical protein
MKIYILMSEGCQCCSSTVGYYLTEQQAIKDKNQMIKDGYQNASIETAYPCDLDDWRKQIVTDYATPWCWYVNPEKLGYTREQAEQIDREEAEPCGSNQKTCGSSY